VSSSGNVLDSEISARAAATDSPRPQVTQNRELVTVIEPPSGWRLINVRELWKFRELLGYLVWRDVKVRYKQTLLGAAWAILQPLLMMIVFTIFFGRMAGVQSGGQPYPLFVFAGLLPWTFFATAIANAGNSVVGNERLISKIYFPRLAIPFASVGAALVDFAVAFSMMIVLMAWYRVAPTLQLLWVPFVVALITLAGLGVGTLLASLNVAYRDFRYVIPFLVQLWMFATPTVYMQPANHAVPLPKSAIESTPITVAANPVAPAAATPAAQGAVSQGAVPDYVQALLDMNPMVGLIAFFRATVLGTMLPWGSLAISSAVVVVMFVVGCLYFRHVEESFADII
jgi:lipopolysaccharide transport system permease protein